MNLNNSKTLLFLFSTISLMLVFVLIWEIYSIQTKNEKTSEFLNLVNEASEVATIAQSIRVAQNEASEDIDAFENLVLTQEKMVELIEDLEKAGRSFGLEIKTVSVEKNKNEKLIGAQIVRIVMESNGSWSGNHAFLRMIENLPHRVMIDESTFSKRENGWFFKISFSLYLFE